VTSGALTISIETPRAHHFIRHVTVRRVKVTEFESFSNYELHHFSKHLFGASKVLKTLLLQTGSQPPRVRHVQQRRAV